MRASVSDITLFRKCPRAWQYSRLWRSASTSPALEFGTRFHKEVEVILKGNTLTSVGDILSPEMRKIIKDNIPGKYNVSAVEPPFELDFRGHTILGRPDAVLTKCPTYLLFQIKTVAKHVQSHLDYLLYHPHEVVYAHAISKFVGSPVRDTVLMRYVKVKEPYLLFDLIHHDEKVSTAVLNGLESTLNEMERYDKTEAPQHTEQCVNWFTGAKCPYIGPCLGGATFAGFKPAEDRYPEFSAGFANASGVGGGNIGVVGGDASSQPNSALSEDSDNGVA